jgi:hypothetical protein
MRQSHCPKGWLAFSPSENPYFTLNLKHQFIPLHLSPQFAQCLATWFALFSVAPSLPS